MKEQFNDPLLLAGKVLAIIMQGIMAFAGIVLAILIPVLILFQDTINAELRAEQAATLTDLPVWPVAGLFVCVLIVAALVFLFFGKLRAIIGTVTERDPFVPENAERLNGMAWLLLAVQVLMIPAAALGLIVAEWSKQLENTDMTVDAGLDLTGIMMVIVLFILARVFKQGAAMRADLEGTV